VTGQGVLQRRDTFMLPEIAPRRCHVCRQRQRQGRGAPARRDRGDFLSWCSPRVNNLVSTRIASQKNQRGDGDRNWRKEPY
jgi:hypothetical protein